MYADTLSRTPRHTVLAIPGSLRRDSRNRLLLQAAATSAPAGMNLQVYDQLASVPLLSEDTEAEGVPAGVQHLTLQVVNADAILIATPEYNQSMPGVLKNAIDWLSRAPEQVLIDNRPRGHEVTSLVLRSVIAVTFGCHLLHKGPASSLTRATHRQGPAAAGTTPTDCREFAPAEPARENVRSCFNPRRFP